jgi:hypothetical protein
VFVVEGLPVLPVFVEEVVENDVLAFGESIKELVVITVVITVHDRWIPRARKGHDLVREGLKLVVRGWAHRHVSEAVDDA